ncbi:DNA-directed DNA polymerase [Methanohalophilus halophilus]|uniref:DNA polymerase n=1 Tax=Methanohalophilus halophilus TaxID=2177 RepID=A0A1L3Q1G1_9EURY|nr:DNA-directed DNA polymerase [Methanohalophilus halophilus]APH38673.1 DNA polymerase elongation subunit [Methanohalophilus halophilus]RNI08327.1 DNA polymerase elongation subunit [Methanohalophilus halophilus]SDX00934.1 replicative DNA polymerase I [Methanohalophilus halophilus]
MATNLPDQLEFQLIDADYFRQDNSPVIRLFGRSSEGKSICCQVPGFEPYFYVNCNADLEQVASAIKQKFEQVKAIEEVERFEPVGYQTTATHMLKIITHDPGNVPEIRDDIAAMPAVKEIYEADILFRNRFLIDRNLHGMGWMRITPQGSLQDLPLCNITCSSENVEEFERKEPAPLRNLAFDIECLPVDGNMPTPETSPVIMISISFAPAYQGKETIVLIAKPAEGLDGDVEACQDEASMLSRFFEIFREYDPDVVTGYNSNDFDIPYITDRVSILNTNGHRIKSDVGRDGRSLGYRKIGTRTLVDIPGRAVVDVLPLIRQEFSLKRYTLRNVSHELLDKEKLDVSPQDMEEYWEDDGAKLYEFINYARRDSELALELLLQLKLLDKHIAVSQVSGTLLQDVISGGQTNMVEQLLLSEYGKQNRVMSSKPDEHTSQQRRKMNENLKGGAVLEPHKGLHENVLVLDYKSLYPTIIMAHNLCYTTVVENTNLEADDLIISPTGDKFVKPRLYKGIVPSVLEDLLRRRSETKQIMKKTSDENQHRVLDATQLALKILLNSFYGYSGYARARLYSLGMAGSVTSIGRENIARTEEIVCSQIGGVILRNDEVYFRDEAGEIRPDDKQVNLSIVYGDTDSVFVHCMDKDNREISPDDLTLEESARVGSKVASLVTASLPDPMELEFEATARRVLLVAKKRYAQWLFEPAGDGWKDKIKVKGLETVRRDWCELTSNMLNRVLEYVLKEGNVEKAVEHVKTTVDRVRNLDVTRDSDIIDDLVLTKTFSKSPSSYKNKQPHLTVVEKIEQRTGMRPSIGERIPFVIVAGKDLFVNRAEDPEYVRQHNIALDVDYYIQKQLLPPVERILSVFGVNIATLDHDSRQKGLFDFSKTKPADNGCQMNAEIREPEKEKIPENGNQSSLLDF